MKGGKWRKDGKKRKRVNLLLDEVLLKEAKRHIKAMNKDKDRENHTNLSALIERGLEKMIKE